MATYTWIGGTSTDWSNASNWSSSPPAPIAPQTSDDVIFGPDNNPCTITTPSTCRTLTINSGYNQLITLNADLVVGAATFSSLPNTGITINGTPTFTGSGWLTLGGDNNPGLVKSISSSANVEIYRLFLSATNAQNVGASLYGVNNLSGSIIVNNLRLGGGNKYVSIANSSVPLIVRNKPNETALVTGNGPYDNSRINPALASSPIYTITTSGSISWEAGGPIGGNLHVASGSIFRLTGSGNSFSIGPSLWMTNGNNFVNVDSNATLLCTTSSSLLFANGSSPSTPFNLHMSGSTTNIWNNLALYTNSVGQAVPLNISSDVYLRKNTGPLPDPTNSTSGRLPPPGSLMLGGLGNTNPITTTGGSKIIYVGGSIMGMFANSSPSTPSPAPILANTRFISGGPKIIMYGTGYIGFPPVSITNLTTTFYNVGLGIDFDISSSGTIRWGTGYRNFGIYCPNVSIAPTWSYVTAGDYETLNSITSFAGTAGLINFQNRSIWDLSLNNGASPTLSSSLVLSGSLSIFSTNINNLNTSSLTNPSLTILQNIQSFYTTGTGNSPTPVGQLRGNAPITMSGNLPATYSLLVPINNGRGNDILINKPGRNLLITNPLSGSGIIPTETKTSIPLTYDSGTFRWIAGTVDASNSTLRLGDSASMDTTNNVSWYNIIVSGSGTGTARGSLINIISPLVISNELNLGAAGNVTFTGSDTWTCSRLVCTTPGRRIILQDAVSNGQKAYRTTAFVNLSSSNAGSPIIMSSSATPTTRASWSSNASPSNVYNVNGIYIDSSNGNTIWTTGITQSTINWNLGSQPLGSLFTFFID